MGAAERAFWQFHASLMEPWDGPACVTFTDGTLVGAVLDRNGLRPGRWWRTIDDRIILASESGVLDVPSAQIVAKGGRLQPGKMFLVDTAAGRIVSDDEIKDSLSKQEPYGEWLHAGLLDIATLPDRAHMQPNHESVVRRQIAFGYTEEDLRILLTPPMAASGTEPLGRWAPTLPPRCCRSVPACSTTTSSSSSRRSPTRRWTRSARPSSPRWPASWSRAESARTLGGVLPPNRAALAGSRQRRTEQARAHQRRR